MDKMFFKVGDEYKICSKCRALAAAKLKRCDECRELLPTKFTIFTQEDYDAVRQGVEPVSIHKLNEDYTQQCSDCGKLYTPDFSACTTPNCHGVLMPYFGEKPQYQKEADEEPKMSCEGKRVKNSPVDSQNDAQGDSQIEIRNEGIKGNYEEAAGIGYRYYFEAYRYEDGRRIRSNTELFPIDGQFIFDRSCLYNDERFFFRNLSNDQKREIAQKYANIKREAHCYLIGEDGRLFVQLASLSASVRINGNGNKNKIITMDRVQLHDGDELFIGSGDDRNHKIVFVIRKQAITELRSNTIINPDFSDNIVREISDKITKDIEGKMEKSLKQIKNEITDYISSLNIESIRRGSGEDEDGYVARVLEAEEEDERNNASGISAEEWIHRFLMIQTEDGQVKDCFGEYEALKDRQQLVMQLRALAKFENLVFSAEDENQDYSNLVIIIGKIIEEVIMIYLALICYKVFDPEFEKDMKSYLGENSRNLEMGFVVRYLTRGEGCSKKIRKIVRAANLPNNQDSFNYVRNLIKELQYGADKRNQNGGHSPASKGATNKDVLKGYVENNVLTIFTKEEYLIFKRRIFGQELFTSVKALYETICEK